MRVQRPHPQNSHELTTVSDKRHSLQRADIVLSLLHPSQQQDGIRNHVTLDLCSIAHSAAFLACDLRCAILSTSKFHRPEHFAQALRFFNRSTRDTCRGIQMRFNSVDSVPLPAQLRKREQQDWRQGHSNRSQSSFSINLVPQYRFCQSLPIDHLSWHVLARRRFLKHVSADCWLLSCRIHILRR